MENFEKTASVAKLVPKVPRPTEYEIHLPRPLALQDASKRVLIGRVPGPRLSLWEEPCSLSDTSKCSKPSGSDIRALFELHEK
jgi:hypothetical protein